MGGRGGGGDSDDDDDKSDLEDLDAKLDVKILLERFRQEIE